MSYGNYQQSNRGDYNDPRDRGGYNNNNYNAPTPRGGGYNDPPPPRHPDRDPYRDERERRPPPMDDPRYGRGQGGHDGGRRDYDRDQGGQRDYDRGQGGQRDYDRMGKGAAMSYGGQQQQQSYRGDGPGGYGGGTHDPGRSSYDQRGGYGPRGGRGGPASPPGQREDPRSNVNTDEVLKHIREKVASRGSGGIAGFGRMFRLYDRDHDHSVDREELDIGLKRYGVDISAQELESLFVRFDRDQGGTIDFNELLRAIRPPMSKGRLDLIDRAFNKLDVTGDGVIKIDDLARGYRVDQHPKYKSGQWTKQQVFKEFLDKFQSESPEKDDKVTRQEFHDYYCGVSMSIDKDVYFDFMMRQTWKFDMEPVRKSQALDYKM